VVARGAALVVAGIATEWLLRTAARNAVPDRGRKKAAKTKAVEPAGAAIVEEVVAVRTVTMRRVILRR
jgi:hypothetical protein